MAKRKRTLCKVKKLLVGQTAAACLAGGGWRLLLSKDKEITAELLEEIPATILAEALYRGEIGPKYLQRNLPHLAATAHARKLELRDLVKCPPPWLEVGCGARHNLTSTDVGLDIDVRLSPQVVGRAQELPFKDRAFACVLCVGVLMHLPAPDWQQALLELARVSSRWVMLGEYITRVETDLLWDYSRGTHGDGVPGLLWARPYPAPTGFQELKSAVLDSFGPEVTFIVFRRRGRRHDKL